MSTYTRVDSSIRSRESGILVWCRSPKSTRATFRRQSWLCCWRRATFSRATPICSTLALGQATGSRVFEAEELLGVEGATLAMMLLAGEAGKRLVETIRTAVDSAVDLLRTSPPARLVAAGVSGALVAYLSMIDPAVIGGGLRQGTLGIGKAGLVAAQIAAELGRRRSVMHSTSVQPNIPASTVERVARLLVPEALATEQIAMRLGLPTDTVRGTLELHPSFVNSGGSWGVGSLRAPRKTTRQLTPRAGV